ncbi:MAG: cytochrome c maturation protein CcmE [Acidimicrobiia bacterium]
MKRYAKFVIPALVIVVALVVLMVNLSSALVYFHTPTELVAEEGSDERIRLGGRVVPGSVVDGDGVVTFDVEDCETFVAVAHTGTPPQLFAEGIGVVVEGEWDGSIFSSDTMLVKHDEQYRTDYEDYDETDHACPEA